ncbi:MAG TPA: peptidoglycan DD-metalloendopeptidase family protein [Gemmatimonadales bacterium]|jgi:murein DD-endopeptidase MepM/ murein hydrolase activator NlpD
MIRRATFFMFGLAVLVGAAAFGIRGNWPWARLSDVPMTRPVLVTSSFREVRDTLRRGENVSTLLRRQGITGLDLRALAGLLRFDPRKIQAGLIFSVRRDASTDSATHVEFRPSADQRLRFVRTANGWTGETIPIHWSTDTIVVSGEIRTNLYDALDRSVSDLTLDKNERTRLVYQLADVNAYTVDFSRDLQPGDPFGSVVERQVSEDGEVRFGRVLASRFTVGRKVFQAFSYPSPNGQDSYYDADGLALKRAFLMSPVDFRYISSGFSLSRFHPILGLFRKHEGIDFAAAAGSPVRAAGDGVVTVAGWSGGYGNLIEIQHRNGIVTRYGHLSKIGLGIHSGTRVTQGEEIGLVGMTGLATGPHLHYEFRVNGVARDPRSMHSEPGAPLPPSELAAFQHRLALLSELLGGPPPPVTPVTE